MPLPAVPAVGGPKGLVENFFEELKGKISHPFGRRRLAEVGGLVVREPHDALLYRASPVKAKAGTAQRLLDGERAGNR